MSPIGKGLFYHKNRIMENLFEEAYFSQDCNIIIEADLYERGSYKSNIRINKDAFPFILDALKKYKLELQQQLNEL